MFLKAKFSINKIRSCSDGGFGRTYPTICSVVSTRGLATGKFLLPPLEDGGINFFVNLSKESMFHVSRKNEAGMHIKEYKKMMLGINKRVWHSR